MSHRDERQNIRTSLMVQGLRLLASTAQDTGLILDWGTGIP